jgi:hypothetical protein
MFKRVCLISLNLAGGGAQKSTLSQAEMFSKKGFHVDIIIMKNKVDFNIDNNLYNLHYLSDTRFLSKNKLVNFFLFLNKLKNQISLLEKNGRFDLILSNSYDSDQLVRFIIHKKKIPCCSWNYVYLC